MQSGLMRVKTTPLWLQVLSKACVDGGEMVLLTDSQNI